MTLEQKQISMSKARKQSKNGKTTYLLIKDNNAAITQSSFVALQYAHVFGYTLYAKYKNETLTL